MNRPRECAAPETSMRKFARSADLAVHSRGTTAFGALRDWPVGDPTIPTAETKLKSSQKNRENTGPNSGVCANNHVESETNEKVSTRLVFYTEILPNVV